MSADFSDMQDRDDSQNVSPDVMAAFKICLLVKCCLISHHIVCHLLYL